MTAQWRARCGKHPAFEGPWRQWRSLLLADLRHHMAEAHPKISPDKRRHKARKALKRMEKAA
jgi:hypothetical protein